MSDDFAALVPTLRIFLARTEFFHRGVRESAELTHEEQPEY